VSVFYVTFLRFIEVDLIWVFVRRQWNGISFCKRNVGRQAEFAGHQGEGRGGWGMGIGVGIGMEMRIGITLA